LLLRTVTVLDLYGTSETCVMDIQSRKAALEGQLYLAHKLLGGFRTSKQVGFPA
jgi:hypothetical protein